MAQQTWAPVAHNLCPGCSNQNSHFESLLNSKTQKTQFRCWDCGGQWIALDNGKLQRVEESKFFDDGVVPAATPPTSQSYLCEGGEQCLHGSDSTHWVEE
jgi:hypothetical protein